MPRGKIKFDGVSFDDPAQVSAVAEVWTKDPERNLRNLKTAAKSLKDKGIFDQHESLLKAFNDAADVIINDINNNQELSDQVLLVWYAAILLSHIGDNEHALEYIEEVIERTAKGQDEYNPKAHGRAQIKKRQVEAALTAEQP